jgi:hypothetical protein
MGSKYVLFNAAEKTVYQLDDQKRPEQFAGMKVKVMGTYDKDTDTTTLATFNPRFDRHYIATWQHNQSRAPMRESYFMKRFVSRISAVLLPRASQPLLQGCHA